MKIASTLALVGFTPLAFAQVTVDSLLDQMIDLTHLTRKPNPYYNTAQASSYDRKSKTPGNGDWFANADAGQYIRVEEREGRKEYVMADLSGPGAVVRIWSANPAGTLRFYFDGETTPRLAYRTEDLLNGRVKPFENPFGYEASAGRNLYFPFPYEKSLKITVDNSDNDGAARMYYHVGYRTYGSGTPVVTFTMDQIPAAKLQRVAQVLMHPERRPMPPGTSKHTATLEFTPNQTTQVKLDNGTGGAIYEFTAKVQLPKLGKDAKWTDHRQVHNALRKTIVQFQFDGNRCVQAPFADFFGSGPGINPYEGYAFSVKPDGTMTCRFVMPFKENATLIFTNMNRFPVRIEASWVRGPYQWSDDSYHFKTQWSAEDEDETRPMRDMHMLWAGGQGAYVGSAMHISNPVPAWWGEGDEKFYVDGEKFPSTFGTGTEDYYGYAWCSPALFMKPYHAQTRSGTPGNFGHTSVNRLHIVDPIPFQKSIQFDMELWHWAETETTYAWTVYWYQQPGGNIPLPMPAGKLTPRELTPPAPVKGAIEGEKLKIVEATGGKTQIQEGFWETSGGAQLWWIDAAQGDKLVLELPVPQAGRYKLIGNFCMARDYGKHKITINGIEQPIFDFYTNGLEWQRKSLGTITLPKGKVRIEITSMGSNPAANPKRNMFGLDYLLLEKA